MQKIKIHILQALRILKTDKSFIFYNLDSNNKLTDFRLTNDYQRYKFKEKRYKHYKVISTIKTKLKYIKL